ncbi:MAG: GNAT family N-acetyltransferase [Legionellaceae bacterium]|nr:GNAT family N-acetyltransferase [Legionellaceae bacterium]
MNILVNKVISIEDINECLQLRKEIFITGQNVPISEEIDGKDDDSLHYLLLVDDKPSGVARVRIINNYAKIERVGILDKMQGLGLGKMIMQKILSDLRVTPDIKLVKLSSQTQAITFYEKLGFTICSSEYIDAGILHRDMQINIE